MATVENINITVKTNADKAAGKLDSLTTALGRLQSVAGWSNVSALKDLSDAVAAVSSSRVSAKMFDNLADGVTKLGVALKTIGSGEVATLQSITDMLTQLQGVNISIGKQSSDSADSIQKTADATHNVGRAARSASGHTRSLSSALKGLGHSAKSSSGFLGTLFASIKRIAFYRLLRTAIKDVSKAFQDGLKHVYAYSKAVGSALAPALDSIASAAGQMKNQMGAALGELLMTVKPIIDAITAAITNLMQALSALFAALGGRLTYTVAEKTADSWDKATGSAKKYKNTILGFDEINRLNDETGGGGGNNDTGNGGFFDALLPDWAEKIRQAIDVGSWGLAGMTLAEHLNDLIENWDANEAGRILGRKINNAIQFAFGFLRTFNFTNAGAKIADYLNGMLSNIDTDHLGRALVRVFTGILDAAFGFAGEFDTAQFARKISDFLIGVFDEARIWLASKDWKQLGATFYEKISEFVENIDWKGIINTAWEAIGNAVSGVGGFVTGFLEKAGIITEIEGAVQTITSILSGASLALGAILLFTGHIPLGLGLIIAGLAGKDKAKEDWDLVPEETKSKLAVVEAVASVSLLALGIILTLSGAATMLGLGMIAAGGLLLATKAREDWSLVPQEVKTQLALIGMLAGIMLVALGIILILSGAGIGLGIGCILAGGSVLASVYAFNFSSTRDEVNDAMKSIGDTGEGEFGRIVTAINGVIDAVKSVIDWFSRFKTAVGEVNNRLNDIDSHKATYGNAWGEFVRGAELGLYASGGSIPNASGTLFVAGEAGPEIVANMGSSTGVMNVDQMEAAVANGNVGVINAVYGMANMIVKAVESIDPDITLDGESLADKMYRYNQQAANRHGAAMVTVGG